MLPIDMHIQSVLRDKSLTAELVCAYEWVNALKCVEKYHILLKVFDKILTKSKGTNS